MNEEIVCSSENLAATDPKAEERESLRYRRSLFENVTACFCCFQGRGPGRKRRSKENENHYFATGSQGDEKVNQTFQHNEDNWHTIPLGEPGCGDASTPLCGKQGNTEVQDNVTVVHNSEETQMQEHWNLVPPHIERKKYEEERQVHFENLWLKDSLEDKEQDMQNHRSTELKGVNHEEDNYHHVPNKEEQQFMRPKYHSTLSLTTPHEKEQQKGQNNTSSKSDKVLIKKKEDYTSIQSSKQRVGQHHVKALSLTVTFEQEPLLAQDLINIHSRTAVYKEDEGITKNEEQLPETPEHPNTLFGEQIYKKEKEKGQDHVISESTCIPSVEGQQYLGPEGPNTLFLSATYDKKHQKRQKDDSFEPDNAPYRENHEVSSTGQQQSEGLEYFVLSLGVTCEEKDDQDYMSSKSQDALSKEEWDFSDAPKEKGDQGIAAENLSTFSLSLTSETQNQEQYPMSSESQDLPVEEDFNYESLPNMTVQCMEQEVNLLPKEVINETEQQGQNQGDFELKETFCKEKQNYHYVPHRETQPLMQPEYLNNLSEEVAFQKSQKLEGQDPMSSEFLQKKDSEKVPNVEEPRAVGAEDCNTSSLVRTCENEMQETKDHSNRKSLTDYKDHKQERQDYVGKMFFISSSDEETEQDEYDDLIIMSREEHEEEKDLQKTISQGELYLEEQEKTQEPLNSTQMWVSQDTKEEQEEQNLLHILLESEKEQQDTQDSLNLKSPDVPCKNEKVDQIQDVVNTAVLCETYDINEHKEGIICEKTEDR